MYHDKETHFFNVLRTPTVLSHLAIMNMWLLRTWSETFIDSIVSCACGFVFELFRLVFCKLLGISYQKPSIPLQSFMFLSVTFLEQLLNWFRMQVLWNTIAYAWKSAGETVIIFCAISSGIPLIEPGDDIRIWSKLFNLLLEKCLICINCFRCIWTR